MNRLTIFFSYAERDTAVAKRVVEHIEAAGFIVWLDLNNVKLNIPVGYQLAAGIRKADYVIVLVSENAYRSYWVKKEISLSNYKESQAGKVVVIPLVLGDCQVRGFLARKKLHRIEVDNLEGLYVLIAELNGHIDGSFDPQSQFNTIYRGEAIRESEGASNMIHSYGDVGTRDGTVCPTCGSEELLCREIEEHYDSGDWWYDYHYLCADCMKDFVVDVDARSRSFKRA
jgi:hypothetical protein